MKYLILTLAIAACTQTHKAETPVIVQAPVPVVAPAPVVNTECRVVKHVKGDLFVLSLGGDCSADISVYYRLKVNGKVTQGDTEAIYLNKTMQPISNWKNIDGLSAEYKSGDKWVEVGE
jgi:hypothetical protein